MKSLYLLYISAGVALATIFFLYKSHKETMKKMETIQSLVSSIQQVPIMKYNDSEVKSLLHDRCDEIENLLHFVNDDINKKIDRLNTVRDVSTPNKNYQNLVNKLTMDQISDDESLNNNIADNNFFDNFLENQTSNDLNCDSNFKKEKNSLSQFTINNKPETISEHKSSIIYDKSDNNDYNGKIEEYQLDSEIHNNSELENKSAFKLNNNTNLVSNDYSNNSANQSTSDNKIPKLNELKQIAKSKGLSTNGNKQEIINRLIANGHIF
jgi:hypothetical protein